MVISSDVVVVCLSQILVDLQRISRRAGEAGSANVTSYSQLVRR
jgi:hypothetical protein